MSAEHEARRQARERIDAERDRQVLRYTFEHDDDHLDGELALVAAAYALAAAHVIDRAHGPQIPFETAAAVWPFEQGGDIASWYRRSTEDKLATLAKCAASAMAEMERLLRRSATCAAFPPPKMWIPPDQFDGRHATEGTFIGPPPTRPPEMPGHRDHMVDSLSYVLNWTESGECIEGFTVEATKKTASYSGRPLFKVTCNECGQVESEATTGPEQVADYHRRANCKKRSSP